MKLDGDTVFTYEAPACHEHCAKASSSNSSSSCVFAALDYIRKAADLVGEEFWTTKILWELVAEPKIDDVMEIQKKLAVDTCMSLNDALKIPIFEQTLESSDPVVMTAAQKTDFGTYISAMSTGAPRRIKAMILCRNRDAIVILRINADPDQPIYVLFDPHIRTDHRRGPGCTVSQDTHSIAETIEYIYSDYLISTPSDSRCPYYIYIIDLKDGGRCLDAQDLLSKSAAYLSKLPTTSYTASDHSSSSNQAEERKGTEPFNHELDKSTTSACSSCKTTSRGARRYSEFAWQASLLRKLESIPSIDSLSTSCSASAHARSESSYKTSGLPSTSHHKDTNSKEIKQPVKINDETQSDCQVSSEPLSIKEEKKKSLELCNEANAGSSSTSASASTSRPHESLDAALASQLQKEEEISLFSLYHRYRDLNWLIELQKNLEEANSGSSEAAGRDMDWHLAFQLQQASSSSASTIGNNTPLNSSTFTTLQLPPAQENFECGVCAEVHSVNVRISLADCGHMFCKECLTTYTRTKIGDGRYPIFCPECVVERPRAIKSQLAENEIQQLDIPAESLTRLQELQLVLHCITLQCPRCKEVMNVDRVQFTEQSVLVCPLPRCGHKWCKSCLKTLASSQHQHKCKNSNIDRLMKRKGWKYCPGCRTPVQKETGCNHMTCGTPGCNVHFCYKCGVLMVDTTFGGDVGTAVTEHYMECQLFEKRWRCSIQ